jgi:hypothetical protein
MDNIGTEDTAEHPSPRITVRQFGQFLLNPHRPSGPHEAAVRKLEARNPSSDDGSQPRQHARPLAQKTIPDARDSRPQLIVRVQLRKQFSIPAQFQNV